jgi:hypothetical protein
MKPANPKQGRRTHWEIDATIGDKLVEVKFRVDSLRAVRTSLLQVAYAMAESPRYFGYLVLVDSEISEGRLYEEWSAAKEVLRTDLVDRITICIKRGTLRLGVPRQPDLETWKILDQVIEEERSIARGLGSVQPDFFAVILQVLLNRWLTSQAPITSEALAHSAGCSYPTVLRAVQRLGSGIDRTTDRRISLRGFPRDDFARLVALSPQIRETTRFADRSGQPRSLDSLLSRLEKLGHGELAVGGVLGARHYFPDLDLLGAPRLDISAHCASRELNLDFVAKLDPALKRVEDPHEPASVVVHAVRRAESFFEPGVPGHLPWADRVECLLDLNEADLESQARDFLEHLIAGTKRENNE